jgi:hypothetical protein
MAKSDLLKQAIADAKAVKETALANAKIALQEAFAPRLESMLHNSLVTELEDDDTDVNMDMDADLEAGAEMGAEAGAEMGAEAGAEMGGFPDSVNVGLDFNDDGDYDLTGMLGGEDEEAGAVNGVAAGAEMGAEAGAEAGLEAEEDDLNLEEILRELEEPVDAMETEGMYHEGMYNEEEMSNANMPMGGMDPEEDDTDINEIIEAILREEDAMSGDVAPTEDPALLAKENEELTQNLEEAYRTVKHLRSVINEVNLLNAKLLYTNKLFRNFDLNNGQKMKVIENFDRAFSTREAKLVFATLAESFNKPQQKRKMVKESAASRASSTTAPSRQTTQILSEGFEMANRWKKLAGLI